jgi:hypothetical protein
MATSKKHRKTVRSQRQFLYLLASLLLMLVVVPVVHNRLIASLLQAAFLTAVLVTAIVANRERRRILVAGIVVAVVAIPLNWATVFFPNPLLIITAYSAGIAFLGMTAALILISVLRDHLATMQAVVGAICVYLLIGLTWALVYSALEYAQGDAFIIPERSIVVQARDGRKRTSYSQMVYFSFVTMSTLGYGDMLPRTPAAQTAAWMQSVLGQLYLAVLVARLVSVLPTTMSRRDELKE